MKLKVKEVSASIGGKIIQGDALRYVTGVSTDSKRVENGDLFIPIKGSRTDGHKFIEDAIKNGAVCSFTSEFTDNNMLARLGDACIISVKDTLKAFQNLAEYYRKTYVPIPLIGVSGSVGKTTTRQMIVAALSSVFITDSTKGNENSQIGVPKTILDIVPSSKIGVIEMGISQFGEMGRLSKVVKPDMAVLTVIGDSHIANLRSRKNIMLEKLHIVDFMPNEGKLFLNGEDELLKMMDMEFLRSNGLCEGRYVDIRFYGRGKNAYYRASDFSESPEGSSYNFWLKSKKLCHVDLKLHGEHLMLDSLVAMACAVENGIDPEKAAEGLAGFEALNGRGEQRMVKGINMINDAYNASPQSMKASLINLDKFGRYSTGKCVAVLSDMLELGENELSFHEEIGRFIANETKNIDLVLTYGKLSEEYLKGLKKGKRHIEVYHFDTYDKLRFALPKFLKSGDTVLFKGSNSMNLWKIPDEL